MRAGAKCLSKSLLSPTLTLRSILNVLSARAGFQPWLVLSWTQDVISARAASSRHHGAVRGKHVYIPEGWCSAAGIPDPRPGSAVAKQVWSPLPALWQGCASRWRVRVAARVDIRESTVSHDKIGFLTLCAHGHRLAVTVRAKYGSDSEYFDLDVRGPSSCAVSLLWGAGALACFTVYERARVLCKQL